MRQVHPSGRSLSRVCIRISAGPYWPARMDGNWRIGQFSAPRRRRGGHAARLGAPLRPAASPAHPVGLPALHRATTSAACARCRRASSAGLRRPRRRPPRSARSARPRSPRRRRARSCCGRSPRTTRPAVDAVLERTLAAGPVAALRDVVLPALASIGDGWERRELSVAQEHMATHLVERRLLALTTDWDDGDGPRALLACPGGERHSLGLVCFGIALAQRGLAHLLPRRRQPAGRGAGGRRAPRRRPRRPRGAGRRAAAGRPRRHREPRGRPPHGHRRRGRVGGARRAGGLRLHGRRPDRRRGGRSPRASACGRPGARAGARRAG